jgi:hypothetical protein
VVADVAGTAGKAAAMAMAAAGTAEVVTAVAADMVAADMAAEAADMVAAPVADGVIAVPPVTKSRAIPWRKAKSPCPKALWRKAPKALRGSPPKS